MLLLSWSWSQCTQQQALSAAPLESISLEDTAALKVTVEDTAALKVTRATILLQGYLQILVV